MAVFSRNKLKYTINESFFDVWTPQMAYILGFTFADGDIYKSSLSWDIQLQDKNLLEKFRIVLDCDYKITQHRKSSYRLRINNLLLIQGAINMGLLPKKNIRNTLPKIPADSLRHFVRGYLDGDGWLVLRKTKTEFDLGFSSGNKEFLDSLNEILCSNLKIKPRNVRLREKTTPKKFLSKTYMLEFYSSTAYKIASWLYDDLAPEDIYLDRKFETFLKAKELYNYLLSGSKVVRVVQKKFGRHINRILNDLYVKQGLGGEKIAEVLGVHHSSIYRWLEQTRIKYPTPRKNYG